VNIRTIQVGRKMGRFFSELFHNKDEGLGVRDRFQCE